MLHPAGRVAFAREVKGVLGILRITGLLFKKVRG
jgi:hypothetical protein